VDKYGDNRSNKRNNSEKWAKNGEFQRLEKIRFNLRAF